MLITLKQKEIEAALRLYIAQRGINLFEKDVGIAFTAGRKETGISAEVSIEDDTGGPEPFIVPSAYAQTEAILDAVEAAVTQTAVDVPLEPLPTVAISPDGFVSGITADKKASVSLFN